MTPEEVGAQEPRTPDGPSVEESQSGPAAGATGNPAVDSVLASLDQLEGPAVVDHVAVFESAHEELRHLLSEAAEGAPGLGHEH